MIGRLKPVDEREARTRPPHALPQHVPGNWTASRRTCWTLDGGGHSLERTSLAGRADRAVFTLPKLLVGPDRTELLIGGSFLAKGSCRRRNLLAL